MGNNWFEVDTKGLKALQEGKPKHFILRELLQNAFDEDITECKVDVWWNGGGEVQITVEDDSPDGFRDLSDAYTLFKHTYKRSDATKRGRFNLGEKQVFSVCQRAEIITTTGTVIFDNEGRRRTRAKRDRGSLIRVTVRMTRSEFADISQFIDLLLIPKGVRFEFNFGSDLGSRRVARLHTEPFKSFEATLRTELQDGEAFRPTRRRTQVHVHRTEGVKYLYELGIPVCEIDCDFSIDVQQKVPLSTDRDTVSPAFLRELYALVLNHTYDTITTENAANAWVREAISSNAVEQNAVASVVRGRFGEKVVVANPADPVANDDAIANGYHVVRGSELSRDEWGSIRKFSVMPSSTQVFGKGVAPTAMVEPTLEQQRVAEWAKRFFREYFGKSLHVEFFSAPKASTVAHFQLEGQRMGFNVARIDRWTYGNRPAQEVIDLIIHEFGHHKGMHTQSAYHEALTGMGAFLVVKALDDPDWFEI